MGDQAGPGPSGEETAGRFISKARHSVSGEALRGVLHVHPGTQRADARVTSEPQLHQVNQVVGTANPAAEHTARRPRTRGRSLRVTVLPRTRQGSCEGGAASSMRQTRDCTGGLRSPNSRQKPGWETPFCKESEVGTNSSSPNSQAWIETHVGVPSLHRPWGLCIGGEVPKGL